MRKYHLPIQSIASSRDFYNLRNVLVNPSCLHDENMAVLSAYMARTVSGSRSTLERKIRESSGSRTPATIFRVWKVTRSNLTWKFLPSRYALISLTIVELIPKSSSAPARQATLWAARIPKRQGYQPLEIDLLNLYLEYPNFCLKITTNREILIEK